jgi:gliding motility-associated protein GldL
MMNRLKKIGGSVKITTKDRLFNAGYGIGASIVIMGVLFKLMYWEGANLMLTVGLIAEALIFFMSAFERPLKTYEWDKVIDFENGKIDLQFDASNMYQPYPAQDAPGASQAPATPAAPAVSHAVAPVTTPYSGGHQPAPINIEGLSDDDAQRLSQSIQNLARTAAQLNDIAAASLETEKFANSLRNVAENTSKYAFSQESLLGATQKLNDIYSRISEDAEKVEMNTREYRSRVERINSNLAGMNSIYEIQLKDIHAQSVHFHNQTEISRKLGEEMRVVSGEISKLTNVSDDFSSATEKLRTNATELADNIAKLNNIYGNMLNAMS